MVSDGVLGIEQLHWTVASADEGIGREGSHLHDRGRAYFDGGTELEQHRLLCGERRQGRQGYTLRKADCGNSVDYSGLSVDDHIILFWACVADI